MIRRFLRSPRGNIAIISALLIPVIVGFCGLAAETSYWYYRHRNVQDAADLAAHNAAMTLGRGGDEADIAAIAKADAIANGWRESSGTIEVTQKGPFVEVLLILGRAGNPGMSMRAISQEQVLTTGGATRVIDRLEASGLVVRTAHPTDRRGRLERLTPSGSETVVRAAQVHEANIRQYFLEPLPAEHRERFAEDLRILSHAARDALPQLR